MTNEEIEEVINYLNNNKNSLPATVVNELAYLSKQVQNEQVKSELLALDNVFFVESLDDDMLKFIFDNQDIFTDKSISNADFNKLAQESKIKKIDKILHPDEPIDFNKIIKNEHHPKDKGSNYPFNAPPLISREEIQQKLTSFPDENKAEQQKRIDEINAQIKAFHDKKSAENLKALKEKNHTIENTENMFQWINENEINKLQEELATFGTPDKMAKVKKYLDKLVTHKPVLEVSNFEDFNKLNLDCPNFKEVSKFYKGSFVLNNSKYLFDKEYHAPTPILLLGEPGIGKTHFAKRLAKILGTSFHFLDANSITASWVLTGSSGQWQNADAGNIFKYILDSNTVSPVVILDEIDKLSQGKNYDPFSVFHQIFEAENASHFKDEFLNFTFDASKIIYILTANNVNNIPESLLSRMRVFNIERPNLDEMKLIAQNIYKEIVGNSPLLKSKLSEDILNKLVSLPPRDIKKQISNAVFNQLAENQTYDQDLSLDIEKISKNWGF